MAKINRHDEKCLKIFFFIFLYSLTNAKKATKSWHFRITILYRHPAFFFNSSSTNSCIRYGILVEFCVPSIELATTTNFRRYDRHLKRRFQAIGKKKKKKIKEKRFLACRETVACWLAVKCALDPFFHLTAFTQFIDSICSTFHRKQKEICSRDRCLNFPQPKQKSVSIRNLATYWFIGNRRKEMETRVSFQFSGWCKKSGVATFRYKRPFYDHPAKNQRNRWREREKKKKKAISLFPTVFLPT